MRKIFFFIFHLLLLTGATSFAQNINISPDSVKLLLCHKWEVKAIVMSGQEITNMNETLTYEFFNDNTLKRVANKKTKKGGWNYEPQNGLVRLTINKSELFIKSLKNGEFVLATDDGKDADKNVLGIEIVFKITP